MSQFVHKLKIYRRFLLPYALARSEKQFCFLGLKPQHEGEQSIRSLFLSCEPTDHVFSAGADRGLRMRLNIEQYEYMVGPNPGAGIKLLIHDNTEVPLVRDLGNAIPPGTHAYVGIQIVQVRNMIGSIKQGILWSN